MEQTLPDDALLLRAPYNMMISGSSQSGKTHLTKQLVKHIHTLCNHPPELVFWVYSEWQKAYEEMRDWPNLHLVQGLPGMEVLKAQPDKHTMLILDDQMIKMQKNDTLNNLFCNISHHYNLSICMLVQSAFFEGLRTARRNCHYLILFRNPSDSLQISILGRQLFPKKSDYFMEAFSDATSQPHSYLFCDLHSCTEDRLRLRTNILPHQNNVVYLPKR